MEKKTVIYIYQPSGSNLQKRLHGDLQVLSKYIEQEDIKLNGFVLYDHSGLRENIHVLLRMACFDNLERIVVKDWSVFGKTKLTRKNTIHMLIEKDVEIVTLDGTIHLGEGGYLTWK